MTAAQPRTWREATLAAGAGAQGEAAKEVEEDENAEDDGAAVEQALTETAKAPRSVATGGKRKGKSSKVCSASVHHPPCLPVCTATAHPPSPSEVGLRAWPPQCTTARPCQGGRRATPS